MICLGVNYLLPLSGTSPNIKLSSHLLRQLKLDTCTLHLSQLTTNDAQLHTHACPRLEKHREVLPARSTWRSVCTMLRLESRTNILLAIEIRNFIYHYCIDEIVTYLPRRLDRVPIDQLRCYNYSMPAPQCFHLTQISRQIRSEVSPIYATKTDIHVGYLGLLQSIAKEPYLARDKMAMLSVTYSSIPSRISTERTDF
jgi:hypothetical protein